MKRAGSGVVIIVHLFRKVHHRGRNIPGYPVYLLMSNLNLNNDKNALTPSDKEFENNIRPAAIEEFSGQPQLIDNLKVFIKAAKMRGEALDHILFHGPPGLG